MKRLLVALLLISTVFTACNSGKWNNPDPNMPEEIRLRFEEQLAEYYLELDEDPTDAHAMLGVANKSKLLGDYRTAAKYYEMIIDENPLDIVALNNYIVLLEELEEYKDAASYVKTLYEISYSDLGVVEDTVRILLLVDESENAQLALENYVITMTSNGELSEDASLRVSELYESIYQYNLNNAE